MPHTHVRYSDVQAFPGICGLVRELVDPGNTDAELVSIAAIDVEPGRSSDPHSHERTEEIYFILEGTGVVEVDSASFDVALWDSVHIPPGSVHTVRNTGTQTLRLLAINGPAYTPDDLSPASSENQA